ncbi:hypothetical protein EDD37DRAFT_323082 [Exophiala viscosa]|uniref:Uncharacterized protein n=1 Tax=Exophiala viscosa TaxID=2486360 RepID=A0AAN6DVD0_9EURO|nr:hypothetical protein EDD36DRAFT_248254 [Exophiala viscosa]KAI1625955.1 hypothetical protein EDD37DRAFT_323082 [Exophiala viscosa]
MSFTANSRAPQLHPSEAPQEPTGPIASDSLAAESLKNQGGFAENENATASRQPGASSTWNTTDTSGAKVLPPAEDGTTREKATALGLGADQKGVTGVKYEPAGKGDFDGAHTTQGYSGGPNSSSIGGEQNARPAGASDFGATTATGDQSGPDPNIRSGGDVTKQDREDAQNASTSGSTSGVSAGVRPHVDAAPGYTSTVTGAAAPPGTYKPKGDNLEDADLTESIPKTKTFTGNVGGEKDPGRLAEQNFEARNTGPVEQSSGGGGESAVGEVGGSFGALESERAP